MCSRCASRRKRAIERARDGNGPSFLVCNTYRYGGHHVGDKQDYKDDAEAKAWRLKDPIERLVPLAEGIRLGDSEATIAALKQEIDGEVRAAVDLAKAAPLPAADDLRGAPVCLARAPSPIAPRCWKRCSAKCAVTARSS